MFYCRGVLDVAGLVRPSNWLAR